MKKNKKLKQKFDFNNKKYQWELKEVFRKDETPELVMKQWYKTTLHLYAISKDLYRSVDKLLHWIETYKEVERLRTRFNIFLGEKLEAFPKATKWKSLDRKAKELTNKANKKEVSYTKIILSHEKQIKKLLKNEKLKQYKRFFETEFFVFKDHLISTQDSKTIDAMQSDQALDIIQSAIIADCDAEKPHARNSKGNEVKAESFEPLVTSLDPMVRKTAFINFYYQYYLRKNTFSALLYVLNYRATQKAKMYNFVNDIQWAMHDKYELIMDDFFKIVNKSYIFKDLYIRHKDHKHGVINKTFNLDKFEPWDIPLWRKMDKVTYTPEQAKEIVSRAFKCFGPDFSKVTDDILHSNLIKWISDGNASKGNFTICGSGNLNKEPIQVNFDGSANSVANLAHELGHSITYYYIKRSQKTYRSLPALLTEVPSCVCEFICLFYMWGQAKSNLETFDILDAIQTVFFDHVNLFAAKALFKERLSRIHDKEGTQKPGEIYTGFYHYRKAFEGLTKLEQSWYTGGQYPRWLHNYSFLNKLYLDFYENNGIMYYVGAIVGILMTCAIYFNKDQKSVDRFLKFIKDGGTKKPFDALKILKIDIRDEKYYRYAKKIMLNVVKAYETFPTLNKPGSLKFGKNKCE